MPNKFQKQRENKRLANSSEGEDSDDDWEDDPKLADDEPMKTWNAAALQTPEGFTQNPMLVSPNP